MGAIRSLPQTEPNTLKQQHEGYYFVTVYVCGWQHFMQDFQISVTQGNKNLFAIIDGHNGPQVAQLCRVKLAQLFNKNNLIKMGQTLMGMQNIIYQLEQLIYNSHSEINEIRKKNSLPQLVNEQITRAGCSIVLAAITQQQIIIGNVGLCRCYVTYKKDRSKAILFSGNHIPSNKQQQARINRNNGFIYNGKINGSYPYTRSIGDFHLKRTIQGKYKKDKNLLNQGLITCEPSFFSLRKQDIASIFLGSSGIWEKPESVGRTITQLGKSAEKDQQQLQNLLTNLISSQPTAEKTGLQNMMATYISFTS